MDLRSLIAAVFVSANLALAQVPSQSSPTTGAEITLSTPDPAGKISLDGADWQVQSAAATTQSGQAISTTSFSIAGWHQAKVPGTVLANYLRDGLVPDPDFGNQIESISDDTFDNDFWYRREFIVAALGANQHLFLNVDGINWKADIFLNGVSIGHIAGAFARGQFEITDKILPARTNAIAFLIHKVAHPGPLDFKSLMRSHNGGILGRDSPTFLASIGWNWMPTIPGRNIGIWDHVFLQQTGPVMLTAPFVHTTVAKDRQTAELTVEATVANLSAAPQHVTVNGTVATISIAQQVGLAAHESRKISFDKDHFPQLILSHPALWWPNGYGEPKLQHLTLSVVPDQGLGSVTEINFGIRELTYDTSNNILKISCNGQRIQLNGGNWGMDDTLLRYEAKDYDTAIHLHQQMHMTMIRNWVGQVGKEEFFDACDKYGLLVWNDFWLANPADGNDPDDHAMFIANVEDRIIRIRNHPSLALYCGRNEGNPPKVLDQAMIDATRSLDGTRFYIPNSKAGLVTGGGPYEPEPDAWYFQHRGKTLHSELGIVCVPTADTMRLMMPEKALWPIGPMWYFHDFYQVRCRVYTKRIDQSYGPSDSLDEFCEKAQMENWENAKAMMEAWRSNSGSGGLIWMSHPAWPSLICQLYDYYFNPTAAFFGVRIANEPLHVLWDASTSEVKVANNTGLNFQNLHAQAWIYDMNGTRRSHQDAHINAGSDGLATDCFKLDFPADLTPVHFIKLSLTDGSKIVSQNFYWHGTKAQDYLKLNEMAKAQISGSVVQTEQNGRSMLDIQLENRSAGVALMVCAKVVSASASGKRVLPIFYDENYISLLPGEKHDIRVEFDSSLLEGDRPRVVIQGWNVPAMEVLP
jgi:hypothetical protein